MKKENYFLVFYWMISDLKLSGIELLVYAIIYGFTQDRESRFFVDMEYLTCMTASTEAEVSEAIESLIKKDLIRKETLKTSSSNNLVECLAIKELHLSK